MSFFFEEQHEEEPAKVFDGVSSAGIMFTSESRVAAMTMKMLTTKDGGGWWRKSRRRRSKIKRERKTREAVKQVGLNKSGEKVGDLYGWWEFVKTVGSEKLTVGYLWNVH